MSAIVSARSDVCGASNSTRSDMFIESTSTTMAISSGMALAPVMISKLLQRSSRTSGGKLSHILSKGEDVVVCLPGARIEHVTERVEQIMGRGHGGSILVHIGTNNADKEGTTAIVEKYRNLLKKTKQAMVGQIILSGILPVFGNRIHGYRNSKRMAVNGMVKRLCKEEEVGYVDLWDSFVGKEEMYAQDGVHLSEKGAAVFAEGLSGAVASGLGKVSYIN